MRIHIQSEIRPQGSAPQLLQYRDGGAAYDFSLLHATLDQKYPGKNWCKFRRHKHDVFHIVLYLHGEDALMLEDVDYPVGAGSLALISPGQYHDVATQRKQGIVYSEVTFHYLDPRGLALRVPFHELLSSFCGISLRPQAMPLQLSQRQSTMLAQLFARLMGHLEGMHALTAMEVQLAVSDMFAFLIRECYAPRPQPLDVRLSPLEHAKRHIERNFRNPIIVEELAKEASLSKGHFLRTFKKTFGISPIAYQQQLRIQTAMTLLRYTEYSCKDIAERVGYDDEYLFSKTFKKVTGLPATAYRKEHLRV